MLRAADPRDTIEAAGLLPSFDKPALVVWAADDKFFPREHGRRLAELLPQGRFELVENSMTFIPEDNPSALVESLPAFVGVGSRERPLGTTCPRHLAVMLATLLLALLVLLGLIALPGRRPDPARRRRRAHGPARAAEGQAGCIHRKGTNRCAQGRAVTSPEDIAISPDGRHVYVASFGSHGDRDLQARAADRPSSSCRVAAAASVTRAGGSAGRARDGRPGLDRAQPRRRATSTWRPPAATRSASSRATGGPGCSPSCPAERGCVSQRPGGGCVVGRALNEPTSVAVSPDGAPRLRDGEALPERRGGVRRARPTAA